MQMENNDQSNNFMNFLLRIGDGSESAINSDMIKIPDQMIILWLNEQDSLQNLIDAISTTKNEYIDYLNKKIIEQFPRTSKPFYAYDSVLNDMNNIYQTKFLNSLTPNGLPPYELMLKVGDPIICLCNLDSKIGYTMGQD
ncbi:19996_t:CDS:2 [Racocetra fulgida]|uniref:19996_t:CDS:1 n=1 Tax=Racocetra fulgida TaxID=60492 RepID=A0A9N9I6H7_9GLOM|nr:19996_t:CDS:2 [Racocetra fulgida]